MMIGKREPHAIGNTDTIYTEWNDKLPVFRKYAKTTTTTSK